MLYWISMTFKETLLEMGWYKYANVFRYITFRTAMAGLTAFFVCWIFAPWFIKWLGSRQLCDEGTSSNEDVRKGMESKNQTPTMGGVLILAAIFLSLLLWGNLSNYYLQLAGFVMLWLGVLGGVDDWMKIRHKKKNDRGGLQAGQKLLFQLGLALLIGGFLQRYHGYTEFGTALTLPFMKNFVFDLGWLYVPLVILVLVGCSNAVNLTDGMDGLACGTVSMAGVAFAVLAYLAGNSYLSHYLYIPSTPGSAELTVVLAAMVGAVMGFLWYNCAPAEIFMGDTGSLALGGLIGYTAIVIRQEFLLLIVGGIFVAEAGSVILQVAYFKATDGKRIFPCTPIHHSCPWPETKVVIRFWIMAALLVVFAVATLKLR